MATKYRKYFEKMLETEREAFDEFSKLHDEYSTNPDLFQKKFNQNGEKVMKIIHEWESKLCSQSEKAGFGSFTTNLSEKFMSEVRKRFPLIDHVGVISKPKTEFNIKKINFS